MLHRVVWEGLSKSTFEQRAEEVRKQTMWGFGREFRAKRPVLETRSSKAGKYRESSQKRAERGSTIELCRPAFIQGR